MRRNRRNGGIDEALRGALDSLEQYGREIAGILRRFKRHAPSLGQAFVNVDPPMLIPLAAS